MRTLVWIAVVILVLAGGGLAYALWIMQPAQRPADQAKIEATPERLARGAYLVENVLSCFDCHSEQHTDVFSMPRIEAQKGSGNPRCLDEKMGAPGRVCFPNITPARKTGIGEWSEGEIMRAVREGVTRDGRALFPMMPFSVYRSLSDEDARAVAVYLKTIPAIEAEREKSAIRFPVNVFIKLEPQPLSGPVPQPDENDELALGRYLAEIAGCRGCHTPLDPQHALVPGADFSGGQDFAIDEGIIVRSSNLTPHNTGLGDMSREAFIARFKSFEDPAVANNKVPPDRNTLMPWLSFARMTERDLGAIYAFLRTVPPIENRVRRR